MLPLDAIVTDGGTQPRERMDGTAISDYADLIRDGVRLPPVTVFYDGSRYHLADGFHRWEAHDLAGRAEIDADVRQGTQRDAILFSASANSSHGMRRTNADKKRAVTRLLTDHEWSLWSDTKIAERCAVSQPFVSGLRAELGASSHNRYEMPAKRIVERGSQKYEMNVTNIGRPVAYGSPPAPMRREQDRVWREPDEPVKADVAALKRFVSIRTSMREMPDADETVSYLPDVTINPDAVADAERCSDWWSSVAEAMQDRLDRRERAA